MGASRRDFLKASGMVGASVAVELGKKETHSPLRVNPNDYSAVLGDNLSDNPDKEQARYIAKSAEKRSEIYNELSKLFNPNQEDLYSLFEDSIKPSIIDFIPGTAGDALDLIETMQWFQDVRAEQAFRDVGEKGIRNPLTVDGTRAYVGMENAREEMTGIAERASEVQSRAESFSDSSADWNDIIDALNREANAINRVETIGLWAEIAPHEYDDNSEDAAEQVKQNAEATLGVLDEFDRMIENQSSKVSTGEYIDFPKFIAGYNQNADKIEEESSGFMFDRFAGDQYNLVVQNDGKEKYRRWINTDSEASLTEYKLEGDDAKADVKIEEEDFQELLRDSSVEKVMNMHYHGDIVVDGNGIFGWPKYGAVNILTSINRGIDGVTNWMGSQIEKIGNLF